MAEKTARPRLAVEVADRMQCAEAGSHVSAIRQNLELVQGWLERSAVWLEAGQKKLPEAV